GDVRATDPRPWESASGLRRSLGVRCRSEMQGALLRYGLAAVGRLLRGSISCGDDGSISGGHVRAFAYFEGVPRQILYDNTKLAVAKILGGGERKKTRAFSELQSHYLFEEKFGRPGKGNDKGKVEGLVGYARRNFLVPIPRVSNWEELN